MLRAVRVEDLPDQLGKEKVYFAGDRANIWGAALRRPYGCGDGIELNLLAPLIFQASRYRVEVPYLGVVSRASRIAEISSTNVGAKFWRDFQWPNSACHIDASLAGRGAPDLHLRPQSTLGPV